VGPVVTLVSVSSSLSSTVGRAVPSLPCSHGACGEWQQGRQAFFGVVRRWLVRVEHL